VEQKVVESKGQDMTLVVWDIHGDDAYQRLQKSYLRGAAGYFLVADGTRQLSFTQALEIRSRFDAELQNIPGIVLLNKCDLEDQWVIGADEFGEIEKLGMKSLKTSALSGLNVESSFSLLSEMMITNA